MKPFIVRVSDTGHAEAIDYRNYQYKPQEAENKYYLSRWATLYFERNRYTIERDQTAALYFLNGDVQHAVIEREQKDKTISKFSADASLPYVDIDVKNIILDDLHESPYTARIEYDKVFTNADDHSEVRRNTGPPASPMSSRITLRMRRLSVNPLGLTIVRFRTDQAFS